MQFNVIDNAGKLLGVWEGEDAGEAMHKFLASSTYADLNLTGAFLGSCLPVEEPKKSLRPSKAPKSDGV